MQKYAKYKYLYFALAISCLTLSVMNYIFVSDLIQGGTFGIIIGSNQWKNISVSNNIVKYNEAKEIFQKRKKEKKFISKTINKYYLNEKGIENVKISDLITYLIKNKTKLHPSAKITIYAFAYGQELLNEIVLTDNSQLLNTFVEIINYIIQDVNKCTILPDKMKYNDHVISERVEFLLLFLSYLKTKEIDGMILHNIENQIAKDVYFLLDDKRFTWKTNHGLMQLRALTTVAAMLPNSEIGVKCKEIVEQRIKYLLDFFIANDGAILESASGYWLYIYEQLKLISEAGVLNKKTNENIREKLIKGRRFLNQLVIDNGFLQGLGDSYNKFNLEGFDRFSGKSMVSSFGNGLVSLRYNADSKTNQILFVSLDTPPNVHKLPEDLAIYIYSGEPFFINTGTYAYDNSDGRKYVKSEISQSTVTFGANETPIYSNIKELRSFRSSSKIQIKGEKKYKKNRYITRTINFNQITGELTISDVSNPKDSIISSYNVHPDVSIMDIKEDSFILEGENNSLQCSYIGELNVDRSWVSKRHFSRETIKKINLIGKNPTLRIMMPPVINQITSFPQFTPTYSKRKEIYNKMLKIYGEFSITDRRSIKRTVVPRIGLFCIILFVIFMFKINSRTVKNISCIILFISCLLLLIDIKMNGTILSLIF